MYRQVKFIDKFENSYLIGGIGVFENDKLIGVLSGARGGYIEADNIQQYEVVDWIGLSDDFSNVIIEED